MKSYNAGSSLDDDEIKQALENKKNIIYSPLIGSAQGGLYNNSIDGMMINDADMKKYANLPFCMRTPAGSIIPQPFIPSQGYYKAGNDGNSVYNVITFSGDTDLTQTVNSAYNPCSWSVVQMSTSASNKAITNGAGSLQKVYGQREQHFNYITNKCCRQNQIDEPNIESRIYNAITPGSNGGAFAFCYDYGAYVSIKGNNVSRVQNAPQLQLIVSSVIYHDNHKMTKAEVSSHGISRGASDCVITIPPDGQITAQIGKYIAQGALSVPSNDILPPQCKRQGNLITVRPIFIYPIYSGLVITNSLIKNNNGKGKGEQIFVKFNGKTDARFQTRMHEGEDSVEELFDSSGNHMGGLSHQQAFYINSCIQSKTALKQFPSIFQQTAPDSREGLGLSVHSNFRVNFTNKLTLKCINSLCSFAYCPLLFSRTLKFILYFKGANKKQQTSDPYTGSTSVTSVGAMSYHFYPVVYYGAIKNASGTDTDIKWGAGINQTDLDNIGNCVKAGDDVIQDSDYNQTIYKASFQFSANKALRYPLQVFGAICVFTREAHQFNVKNKNGEFTISSGLDFIPCLSSAINVSSPHSSCDNSNIFPLITNCDLQCGLDGVNGTLTIDSYPTESGIKVIKQQQSIGQIDIDVGFVNEDGSVSYEGNESSLSSSGSSTMNDYKSLFKGYAMQVSTNNSENSYSIGINLIGVQRKMQDMKMICAPFWDGDKLQCICAYFESFLNLSLRMVNWLVSDISEALTVNSDEKSFYSHGGNWVANTNDNIIDVDTGASQQFRVGRSWNWQSPHINFTTGTSCLEALNKLADDTACVFVVGKDGVGYFYEKNIYGYPYYVDRQIYEDCPLGEVDEISYKNLTTIKKIRNIVNIPLNMITSFSLHPDLQNKYNAIATFGFLIQKNENRQEMDSLKISTAPGSFYTTLPDGETQGLSGPEYEGQTTGDPGNSVNQNFSNTNYPWQRTTLSVQNGYFTKTELLRSHINRINRVRADFYSGSINVIGNNMVTHIYQVVRINGIYFLITSISHSMDVENKRWTTTYGIQYTQLMDPTTTKNYGRFEQEFKENPTNDNTTTD